MTPELVPLVHPGAARLAPLIALISALGCVGTTWKTASVRGAVKRPRAPVNRVEEAPVLEGRLPNGLQYYVKTHAPSLRRVSLALVVKGGLIAEDDDQPDVSHLVEHLAFSGTRRFPGQAIVDVLEKSGVALGNELSAATWPDYTVYRVEVPSEQGALVGTATRILRDWAADITFEPGAIDKALAVVIAEAHERDNAGQRLYHKMLPLAFPGGSAFARPSPYGGALPSIPPAAVIERYYRDWYRPDLMAVIAAGDLDGPRMVEALTREFGSLTMPANPRPLPAVSAVPAQGPPIIFIGSDSEATGTSIRLDFRRPRVPLSDEDTASWMLSAWLYELMLKSRLEQMWRSPGAPLLEAWAEWRNDLTGEDIFAIGATVKAGHVEAGLSALLQQWRRAERDGFTGPELDRARRSLLRLLPDALGTAGQPPRVVVDQLAWGFLLGEGPSRLRWSSRFAERFVAGCTPAEVQRRMRGWWGQGTPVIRISGPESITLPGREAIAALLERVEDVLPPYVDRETPGALLAQPPAAGRVVESHTDRVVGVTDWHLANGVRVLVKPTQFKDDEVLLEGFAPGGFSRAKDADVDATWLSADLVDNSGLGALDAIALRNALAGKLVQVDSAVYHDEVRITASASPQDLRAMFELTHLKFVGARADKAAFALWRERQLERARHRRRDPDNAFREDLTLLLNGGHRCFRPVVPATIAGLELESMIAAYRERFANAGDFTFVIVGNVDPARVKVLAETYLGSLPGHAGQAPPPRDGEGEVLLASGPLERIILMGKRQSSRVVLAFTGPAPPYPENKAIEALVEALELRLRDLLRERLAAVYDVDVSSSLTAAEHQQYQVKIEFNCAPENVSRLRQQVLDEIAHIAANGVDADILEKVAERRAREHERHVIDNESWRDRLLAQARSGATTFSPPPLDLNAVSSAFIQHAARRYLPPDEMIVVIGQAAEETTTATKP
jgi:zinc protease